jgi:hypothetical protein
MDLKFKTMNKLIYLAIPYSFNPELSFEIANEVAANLMQDGFVVFSPISHTHPLSKKMRSDLQFDHEFWMRQDLTILSRCDYLYVIRIHQNNGTTADHLIENSKGCQAEIQKAKELNMFISNIDYYDCRYMWKEE